MQHKDTGHKNRHTLYVADSGGGKSQALMQNPEVPHQGARTLLYDPNEDHPWCLRFTSMADYKRAARRACVLWYKKRAGFRLAYVGVQNPETHEEWCAFVYTMLDGRFSTYLLDEELAGSCNGAGPADHHHGILLNQSRKGGGVYHATAQKTEEIPKTVFSQCKEKWMGVVDPTTAVKFSKSVPVDTQALIEQPDLSFHVYSKERLGRQPIVTQLSYKDPRTIKKSSRIHQLKHR